MTYTPKLYVYVDQLARRPDAKQAFFERSCHLMAANDTTEAEAVLHKMARECGAKKEWFQIDDRANHYDLSPARRRLAVGLGAIEISAKAMVRMKRLQRRGWLIEPGTGMRMELGRFYAVSDSGGVWLPQGYSDISELAAELIQQCEQELPAEHGHRVMHPKYGWGDDVCACNITLADEFLAFWSVTEPAMLAELNKEAS